MYINPADISTVSGEVNLDVSVYSSHEVERVEFYINNVLKYTDSSALSNYKWDTKQYLNDKYLIKVIAYAANNQTISKELNLYVSNALWEFKTNSNIYSSPAIGKDGTIYVGSLDNSLYAINPDGTKKWEFLTGGSIFASPTIGTDGTIYIASWDEILYAINPDGTTKWVYSLGHENTSSPAIDKNGTIYIGTCDPHHSLYALSPFGTIKWIYRFEGLYQYIFHSSPAIDSEGTIYIGGSSKVYAINSDGSEKWVYETGDDIESSPAIATDGTIYIGLRNNKLTAINSTNGLAKWKFITSGQIQSSPAIAIDGTIYVGSSDNILYAIKGSGSLANSQWPMFNHDIKHTGRSE